ncbi:hypothetical protein ACIRNI_02930 [Streptomyces sp. NPDC093546]|uniref:hypothetical protein n=1 Tax=Streptomyces sp. NPDC093546 TaxID=3366040 RepID=UPI0038174B95
MSEEKQPTEQKPPADPKPLPEQLKPEQRYEQEQKQQQAADTTITGQRVATDMAQKVHETFSGVFGGSGTSVFGKTSFEDAPLNKMLDLLDSANPADLTNAGQKLEDATKALNEAARNLDNFVSKTDWKGEGAEEFRRYGKELVTYTYGLGSFSNVAGAQLKEAAVGLSSVRNSKPPRDSRAIQKKPEDFALPERTEDNPDYQKALKVEKDRQEAINQMNRLASFYAVSESTLKSQEPPKLPKPLGSSAVPPPAGQVDSGRARGEAGSTGNDLSRSSSAQPSEARGWANNVGDSTPRTEVTGKPVEAVGSNPRTEIDSVQTLPPPTTPNAPTPTGPVTGNPGPNAAPPIPGFGPPVRPTAPRATGMPGVPRTSGGPGPHTTSRTGTPNNPTGRTTGTPPGRSPGMPGRSTGMPVTGHGAPPQATGRAGQPMGRSGPMGMPTGQTGRTGGPGQAPVTGRPTTSAPGMAGRQGGPGATPRAGQNGIVGGTPQRAIGGSTGSRIPKGTVIGGEAASTGRPSTARPSQSGVIGANQANGAARATGRGTPSVNGVVGTPRGGATAARPGGAAMGARSGQRQARDEEQERSNSTRPDYLTEDEKTWAAKRGNAVPPVID